MIIELTIKQVMILKQLFEFHDDDYAGERNYNLGIEQAEWDELRNLFAPARAK